MYAVIRLITCVLYRRGCTSFPLVLIGNPISTFGSYTCPAAVSLNIFRPERKSSLSGGKFRPRLESSRVCPLKIIPDSSAAGRLWSCGTLSLARNSRELFLQCDDYDFTWWNCWYCTHSLYNMRPIRNDWYRRQYGNCNTSVWMVNNLKKD